MITSQRRACPVIVPDRCCPGAGFPAGRRPCLLPGGGPRSAPPTRGAAFAGVSSSGVGGRGAGRRAVVLGDRRVGRRRPAGRHGHTGDQAWSADRPVDPPDEATIRRGLEAGFNGPLEHLRGCALGFRNPANYIARSLLEAGGFRPQLHPGLWRARFQTPSTGPSVAEPTRAHIALARPAGHGRSKIMMW